MELGLSLGEAMADAGRELVLGLGVGGGGQVDEQEESASERLRNRGIGEKNKRNLEFVLVGGEARSGGGGSGCCSSLSLLPNLGLSWTTTRNLETSTPTTRGFDVNLAAADDEAEDAAATLSNSPNTSAASFPMEFSTQSNIAGGGGMALVAERSSSRASDDDESGSGSARKKLRLSKEQSAFLEESFTEHSNLNPKQKLALAKQLNLRPRQVEVWFQNRRARTKLKQTEVDCEYLKRCCETLTEENRRLQKELVELRALKTAHPFYMHLPATTLSMCPSCERIASSTSNANGNATTTANASMPARVTALTTPPANVEHRPSSFAGLSSAARPSPFACQPPPSQPPATSS